MPRNKSSVKYYAILCSYDVGGPEDGIVMHDYWKITPAKSEVDAVRTLLESMCQVCYHYDQHNNPHPIIREADEIEVEEYLEYYA